MCMISFIGSDTELPMIDWNENKPGFFVQQLEEQDLPIKDKFTRKNVYYLGSHSKCGCGFQYGQYFEQEAMEETKARADVDQLRSYLTQALTSSNIEVYGCWDSDVSLPALRTDYVNLDTIGGDSFSFEERVVLHLGKTTPC